MQNVTTPKVLCTKRYCWKKKADREKVEFLRDRIFEGYMHHWVVDDMPVTWCYSIMDHQSEKPFCTTHFPVGCYVTENGQQHDACFLSVSCGE